MSYYTFMYNINGPMLDGSINDIQICLKISGTSFVFYNDINLFNKFQFLKFIHLPSCYDSSVDMHPIIIYLNQMLILSFVVKFNIEFI